MPILNKDMQVCISLSGRPSNLGIRVVSCRREDLFDAHSQQGSDRRRSHRGISVGQG